MNENEAYMIPECNMYRTIVFSQEPACNLPSKKARIISSRFDPDHQLKLKIQGAHERLAACIENEGHLISTELKRLPQDNSLTAKSIITKMLNQRIDALWFANASDYVSLCTLNYLSTVPEVSNNTTKSLDAVKNALQAGFEEMVRFSIGQFSKQRVAFKERVAAIVNAWEDGSIALAEQIRLLFASHRFWLCDSAHRAKIQAQLTSVRLTGRTQYTYICEKSKASCSKCQSLAGRVFPTSEAKEGTNLPPMHPNCRCTIQGYPALAEDITTDEILRLISEGILQAAIDAAISPINESLSNKVSDISEGWSLLFENAVKEYYGTFATINIGNAKYHINRNSFTSVAIGPDGEFIVPENAKPYDKHLLELMRIRDELPKRSEERSEILARIKQLTEENDLSGGLLLSIDTNKPYSFYTLGEDITARLNEYMRQTEVDYAYMHSRPWVANLKDFYLLVKGHGEMDLKSRSEWAHSAYIYNGEVISQDALGNINYGYFGTFCNIPKIVLIAGGGYAQYQASKNVYLEFWYTLNDDPRDTFRILQGIDTYGLWH